MRTLIATRAFAPEPAAAAWRQAALATALAEAGHEVEVLTTRLPAGTTGPPAPAARVGEGNVGQAGRPVLALTLEATARVGWLRWVRGPGASGGAR